MTVLFWAFQKSWLLSLYVFFFFFSPPMELKYRRHFFEMVTKSEFSKPLSLLKLKIEHVLSPFPPCSQTPEPAVGQQSVSETLGVPEDLAPLPPSLDGNSWVIKGTLLTCLKHEFSWPGRF